MISHSIARAVLGCILITGLCSGASAEEPPPPQGIVLKKGWDTYLPGGEQTLSDLRSLIGSSRLSEPDLGPSPGLEIYRGVTYLMPFDEACKALDLNGYTTSRQRVLCPGFPRESIFYVAFKGKFGSANFLYLVLDSANQVVGVQLVEETPSSGGTSYLDYGGLRTYNFVNYRINASTTNRTRYKVEFRKEGVCIYSVLYSLRKGRDLERVELYLPQPMVNLMKYTLAVASEKPGAKKR